jgi:hypothetical protein
VSSTSGSSTTYKVTFSYLASLSPISAIRRYGVSFNVKDARSSQSRFRAFDTLVSPRVAPVISIEYNNAGPSSLITHRTSGSRCDRASPLASIMALFCNSPTMVSNESGVDDSDCTESVAGWHPPNKIKVQTNRRMARSRGIVVSAPKCGAVARKKRDLWRPNI